MNKYILDKPEVRSFNTPGADGFSFPIQNKEIEIDFIDSITGHGGKVISDSLSHFYYILEGEGAFEIEGKNYNVKAGQLVEIPPQNAFDYTGKMKMILIMQPPFDPSKIKHLN